MKVFTAAMFEVLKNANEAVKGTSNYHKYYMTNEVKINGKWVFIGHYTPFYREDKPVKTYRDNSYIMVSATERCLISKEVFELVGDC